MNPSIRPPPCVLFFYEGDNVQHYADYLETAGLRVVAAHGDGSAVEAALAAQPDIIVLDFEQDGDAVTELKNDPRTRHIPIIAFAELAVLSRTIATKERGKS